MQDNGTLPPQPSISFEQRVQNHLNAMTMLRHEYNELEPFAAIAWFQRQLAVDCYVNARNWLIEQGITPIYDRKQQRYVEGDKEQEEQEESWPT